jgi:hypothetical protein
LPLVRLATRLRPLVDWIGLDAVFWAEPFDALDELLIRWINTRRETADA